MNHDKFLGHLNDSKGVVMLAAQWLSNRGHPVIMSPTRMAPRHADWKMYADSGDLMIGMRVEVKGLTASFTCAGDWPFGDKFIVCAKHSWDMADQKPYAYIYYSKDRSHIAVVRGDTSKQWYVEKRRDKRYDGVEQDFYLCPICEVKFMDAA